MSEWVLFNTKHINFSAISWWEQVIFQWDDDDEVHFVLDQHAELDFISASSLKQQSADLTERFYVKLRHVVATILDSFDAHNIYFLENVIS
jgi:hypothetical protein